MRRSSGRDDTDRSHLLRVASLRSLTLKRQLTRRGIAFEALDDGILSCGDRMALQRIAARLDEKRIEAEFSLTQALDQPVTGRMLFDDVIREKLDLGRPLGFEA